MVLPREGGVSKESKSSQSTVFSRLALCSPLLFPRKSLVEKGENLGDVELNVFEIKIFLVVSLHLEQIIELEIKLEQSTVSAWVVKN